MKRLWPISIFLLVLTESYAQTGELKFTHLSVKDGLSQNWVRTIHQDKMGFLWFGSNDGLNRYDGYKFKIYKNETGNPLSLINNNVQVIHEDRKGRLWVGVQRGLNLYDRELDLFRPVKSTLGFDVKSILEMENGDFLIGGPEGLCRIDPDGPNFQVILTRVFVNVLFRDNRKNIWLGTQGGLLLFNPLTNSFSTHLLNEEVPDAGDNEIQSIYQDSRGRIWIGNNNMGLYLMDYEERKPWNPWFSQFEYKPSESKNSSQGAILKIMEDHNGNLWVGTGTSGLDIIQLSDSLKNPRTWHYEYNPLDEDGITSNSIHTFYQDNQNTIWVGTYGGGISYFNDMLHKFTHIRHIPYESSISDDHVSVLYNEKDYLWIGTEGGLNVFNKKTGKYEYYVFNHKDPNSLGSDAVYAIKRDSRGNLWIGTWAGGLNLFNEKTKTFRRFQHDPKDPSSIGSDNVFSILEDSHGNLWIGTMSGGLNKFNYEKGTFERYVESTGNSISNNWVRNLLESSYGELWISTANAVVIFTPETGRFKTYRHDSTDIKSICYDGAVLIFEDSRKNIWIGTEGGLNFYHRETDSFTHFTEKDGLPNNAIKGMVEDDHGNLWISTNKGVSKFVHGIYLPERPKFENYFEGDGLQGDEFSRRTYCKDQEGRIYFGGTQGFNVFHPDSIKDNMVSPVVVFTNFQIFNKPISIGGEDSPLKKDISLTTKIKLKPWHTVFSIEFAALSFVSSHENTYAFILEGFEKEWNYVGTQRSATYTNLDPGTYVFKVKASNNDGLWSKEEASLIIEILPAWWQTIWAKIAYVVIVLVALYFFRKYTLISVNMKNKLWVEHIGNEKTEELNQMKFQFFTNISHELRTPLTLITGPLRRLTKNGNVSYELELINRNAARLKRLVDQILDFQKMENNKVEFNPDNCDIIELIKNVILDFQDLAGQRKINLRFAPFAESFHLQVDRDKIEKIIANLISNAIKYTGATGSVHITIDIDDVSGKDSGIVIKVSDTGIGIAPEDLGKVFDRFYSTRSPDGNVYGTGIGLHLTKKLVEMHDGSICVQSIPNQGSVFIVTLPLIVQEESASVYEKPLSELLVTKKQIKANDWKVLENGGLDERKPKVLVIEDNPEMCQYLVNILIEDFAVLAETQPLEGMNKVLKYLPDLIISDVMMPELNGFDLCKSIKTDIRISHIPVILLTAKAAPKDHKEGLETGADDYIYKPFDEDLLKTRVKNLIHQREKLRKYYVGEDGAINTKSSIGSLDKLFMDKIMCCVKENYAEPDFNVNQIIKELAMSRSVFYKKFKSLSDQSINDLIRNFRLKRAEELLLQSDLSVSEVAYSTGFNNQTYFSTVFKEFYSVSPTEFKQSRSSAGVK